jgi:hypothetical protein
MTRPLSSLALLLAAATLAVPAFAADSPTSLEHGIIRIHSSDLESSLDVFDLVHELGGRHLHLLPPHLLLGELPIDLTAERLGGSDRVTLLWDEGDRPEGTALGASPAATTPAEAALLEGWRRGRSGRLRAGGVSASYHSEGRSGLPAPGAGERFVDPAEAERVRRAEAERLEASVAAGEPVRGPNQNSAFMLGRIVMNLILPESRGTGSDLYEDWTNEEISDIVAQIIEGWTTITNDYLYAPLDIIYNIQLRVALEIEPSHYTGEDVDWIRQVMTTLGRTEPAGKFGIQVVHAFNNDMRSIFRADWVFTAFVVDTSTLPDHFLTNSEGKYIGYAYMGGPYLIAPYPAGDLFTWGFGPSIFKEIGHCFWALDETPDKGKNCQVASGYLNAANTNSLAPVKPPLIMWPCGPGIPCAMYYGMSTYCPYTAAQVGLVDTGDDRIPRIWNVEPTAVFDGGPVDTLLVDSTVVRGLAFCPPYPNNNPSIEPEVRIDHSARLRRGKVYKHSFPVFLKPDDGKWDSTEERFSLKVTDLIPGANHVGFVFTNEVDVDNSTAVEKTLFVVGINFNPPVVRPYDWMNEVSWSVAGVDFDARYTLYRRAEGEEEWELLPGPYDVNQERPGFKRYTYRDREVRPGEVFSYYARGEISILYQGEMREFEYESPVRTSLAQAPLGSGGISRMLPNPMRHRGLFSFVVPPRYVEGLPTVGDGRGAVLRPAPMVSGVVVPTRVKVEIYNVKGQRIRTLLDGSLYGGHYTRIWDARDDQGWRVSAGVYFVRVKAGETISTRKVVVLE